MRKQREFYKGGFYHVFNRGVNKEIIFREKEDFILYLYKFKEALKKLPIVIHYYNGNNWQRQTLPEQNRTEQNYSELFDC